MKKKYHIEGIDCANCAAKVEKKMNDLPDVSVTLTFATSQLLVEAENPDEVLPKLREIADKMEPGTVIEEISKAKKHSGKKKTHHHHDDEDSCDDDCCCHGEHEEHEHHHHHHDDEDCCDGDCCCHGEHEGHEHHHHKHLDGVTKKKYRIEGIDCPNCAAKVERKMNELPDVAVTLTFATSQLLVEAKNPDEVLPKLREIADKMEPGTVIEEYSSEKKTSVEADEDGGDDDVKVELIKIAIGAFVFIGGVVCQKYLNVIPAVYIELFVVSYIILGGEVVLKAVKNLFRGKLFDENFLMSIATIGAFATGEYPEAVGVMLFYEIGELFEDIAVGKSRKQIMEAVDMRPEVVRYIDGDNVIELDPEEIEIGDIIEVRPGDRIPLDGVVVKGDSRIDTSAVTGEPVPVGVKEGSEVVSGCVNMSGLIYVKVEKLLEESMVSRILEAVENAAASKPKIDRFISKFARIYTPIVVFAALATAVIPSLITGNWHYWVYTALTFLVISCPCALVLSVPLAFFAGIGAGSKKGILFKGGVSLESLAEVKAVVIDKTGTVTEGNFKVAQIVSDGNYAEDRILAFAGAAESRSTHPIATSIMEEVKKRRLEIPEVKDIKEISGKGMEVTLDDGMLLCGNIELLTMKGIEVPSKAKEIYGTEVLLAFNEKYIGYIVINDKIKSDSKQAISDIKRYGLWTAMLTGDAKKNAEMVAKEAGIDICYAKQLPQDKLNNLSKIREEKGAVMFVGDGINDAPVLAGADVGAAMGSGADAAIEAADVVFMNSRLSAIPESIKIAKKTKAIAMQNVIGALVIKALVMVLGFAGIASMWMAVFADSGVAMICVLNSVRILFGKKK
ncbi:heavy metal translocating P-type ATPase [Butyribacter sp.]|uniref:heavy metal translocating P-type ATPase n=1 Tax=Butyribacter sp. TaxID=2822465 RepID=UPI002A9C57FB|nr:heavy metal translocating P-type ATPase [Butyribacter sp.]